LFIGGYFGFLVFGGDVQDQLDPDTHVQRIRLVFFDTLSSASEYVAAMAYFHFTIALSTHEFNAIRVHICIRRLA
jgi:hypothetical protein